MRAFSAAISSALGWMILAKDRVFVTKSDGWALLSSALSSLTLGSRPVVEEINFEPSSGAAPGGAACLGRPALRGASIPGLDWQAKIVPQLGQL
jgi:hypothetical protein